MSRQIGWGVLICGGLLVVVLGPRAVWSHVAASRQVAKEAIERGAPDAELLARLRILVNKLAQAGDEYRAELGLVQHKHDQLIADKEKAERQLKSERDILGRAQEVLVSGQADVKIGNRLFTIEQVQADCALRLEHCQRLDAEVALKAKALDSLATTIARGRAKLNELESVRKSKLSEIESLEVRLQNAGMLAEVNAWTSRLEQTPEGLGQDFVAGIDELQRRVLTLESQADMSGERLAGPSIIDWTEPRESSADLAGEISRYLKSEPRGAAPDTASASR